MLDTGHWTAPHPTPQTPHPTPKTPDPKPQTQTPNPEPQTPNPKTQNPKPKPQTPNLKPNASPRAGSQTLFMPQGAAGHISMLSRAAVRAPCEGFRAFSAEPRGHNLSGFEIWRTFAWKPRPESGLECRTCAMFGRLRSAKLGWVGFAVEGERCEVSS